MNEELLYLRRVQAKIKWNLTTKISIENEKLNSMFTQLQNDWRMEWCSNFQNITEIFQCSNDRIIDLLCSGPIYTPNISK